MGRIYTIYEVSRETGIGWGRIMYHHNAGTLPQPELSLGGKNAYTEEDVERIRSYFAAQKKWSRKPRATADAG